MHFTDTKLLGRGLGTSSGAQGVLLVELEDHLWVLGLEPRLAVSKAVCKVQSFPTVASRQ